MGAQVRRNLKEILTQSNGLQAIFGVLSDIQYADIDDVTDCRGMTRYYRNSINLTTKAIEDWKEIEQKENMNFKFLIQLGDLFDVRSKIKGNHDLAKSTVLSELKKMFENPAQSSLLHIWGNHELSTYKRSDLIQSELNTALSLGQNLNSNANYFRFQVTDKLVLLCLDQYEYSVLGYDQDDPIYLDAFKKLSFYNKNEDLNSSEGIQEGFTQFSKLNGAIGESQLKWLEFELTNCKEKGQKVIVCGHIPIHSQAPIEKLTAWNANEILNSIWKFEHTVIAYLCGHAHSGGYCRDQNGIHHVTFKAILETEPGFNSYATVYVFNDKVVFKGVGKIPSFEVLL